MSDTKLMEELETLLDRSDIVRVVSTLARICTEKSEHVRTNWGPLSEADKIIGNAWEHNAKVLGAAEVKLRPTF
jgi:hypothetical protein